MSSTQRLTEDQRSQIMILRPRLKEAMLNEDEKEIYHVVRSQDI